MAAVSCTFCHAGEGARDPAERSARLSPLSQPIVFIIDDDPDQVALLTAHVERSRRFVTKGFTSPIRALEHIASEPPDAIVCDLMMPGMSLDDVERAYISAALARFDGNVQAAAESLGVTRKVLWARRRKLGLLAADA